MFKKLVFTVLFMCLPISAFASTWQLDAASSSVNFVSVKKTTVGEVHAFKEISGSLDANKATVTIALASVETNISIRNERLKTMLFNIANFATSTISATVNSKRIVEMSSGEIVIMPVDFEVALHGEKRILKGDLQIVKLNDKSFLASSVSPIILNAQDFGLEGGVAALQKVANLPSISTAIPVTFNLVFKQ